MNSNILKKWTASLAGKIKTIIMAQKIERIDEYTRHEKHRFTRNAIGSLLGKGKAIKDFTVLTSANPDSKPLTDRENDKLFADLKKSLKSGRYVWIERKGHFGGNTEDSLFILNMPSDSNGYPQRPHIMQANTSKPRSSTELSLTVNSIRSTTRKSTLTKSTTKRKTPMFSLRKLSESKTLRARTTTQSSARTSSTRCLSRLSATWTTRLLSASTTSMTDTRKRRVTKTHSAAFCVW